MEDLALLAETLTIFDHGHTALTGPTADVFTHLDQITALGLEPPVSVQVSSALRQKGWPLSAGILSLADLVQQVSDVLRRVVR
jgi:cytosine/adenosine deaminase-related metal-dependent hydrolase